MKREIKFRAWDGEKMLDWPMLQGYFVSTLVSTAKNNGWQFLQFTGIKDKNDVDICDGDLVEVKLQAYDKSMNVHAIYEVRRGWLGNIELRIRKLFEPEQLMTFLTLDADDLREDYVNRNFTRLAIRERWYTRGDLSRTQAQQNDYSNDIAVIGNLYENPELLEMEKVDFQTTAIDG